MKRWLLRRTKIDTAQMAQDLNITEATACVLAHRGIRGKQEARDFLSGATGTLRDSAEMKDMQRAVALIKQGIAQGKAITIYGDYDVDGVTSTTILYKAVTHCGGRATYYLPHRQKEGYGLNKKAVETLAQQGTELLFTCDNGIAALGEIKLAQELGMQVIVLDHHEPAFLEKDGVREDILPSADAIVDPKQRGCTYPFDMLCAGGLAYKFAQLLLQEMGREDGALEKELLVFAGIATVCDIVDLLDENRILVQGALQEMARGETRSLGLGILLEEAGLAGKTINEYHLGFIIGPCINAAGRLESGMQVVDLFCTDNPLEAREIAKSLVALNQERKELTAEAVERVRGGLEASDAPKDKVLVLYDKDIHESIAGIVAGRVKDAYYRPTIVLTGAEEGAKGSGRSIEGYHIFEEMLGCRELFTRFGGHAMAAGLSLPEANIPALREMLNQRCVLTEEQLTPVLRIDKMLSFSEINFHLLQEIEGLAPFGKANHKPLFASVGITVAQMRLVGQEKKILSLTLSEEESGSRLAAISFDGYEALMGQLKRLYPPEECDKIINSNALSQKMDFVYEIDRNTYQGRSKIQLMIKDFRFSK